jgi:hypothetical protein
MSGTVSIVDIGQRLVVEVRVRGQEVRVRGQFFYLRTGWLGDGVGEELE